MMKMSFRVCESNICQQSEELILPSIAKIGTPGILPRAAGKYSAGQINELLERSF